MKTAWIVSALVGVMLATAAPLTAQRRPEPPVPVTGRDTEVTLRDGTRLRGELIEATGAGLFLAGMEGPRTDFGDIQRVRVRQHDFGATEALVWVGIGATLSGVGMAVACSKVEDYSCGGVFPAVALSFGLIGGLFSVGLVSSGWRDVPVDPELLRGYARFPQGAPAGFTP